jgi:opacity protein-like surface antigen
MKRSFLVIPSAAIFLLAVSAVPAAAQYGMRATEIGPYTTLKAGGYFPQASDVDDFDDTFYAEIAFGGRVHPAFALELGVGWFKTDTDFILGTGERDLQAVPVMLNAKVPIPLGPVNPYILAGIGGYWAEEKHPILGKDDDITFGWQAGAGIDFELTPRTFLGVEGKYFWASPNLNGRDIDLDGFTVTGNLGLRF